MIGGRDDTVALGRWVWEWVKILATALVVFVFLRSFVVEAFQIPTSSMENTLLVGDFLLVSKAAYGAEVPGTRWDLPALARPENGDVVVFRPPGASGQPPDTRYVKRVVGVPGDTVEMRRGILYRNGRRVREPYAKHVRSWNDPFHPRFLWQRAYLVGRAAERASYRPTRDNWGPIAVPTDSFYVMGDNRDNSEDSRYWGFVPRDDITGKPLFVYYSFDREARASLSWLTEVRWRRFLEPIH